MELWFLLLLLALTSLIGGGLIYTAQKYVLKPLITGLSSSFKYLGDAISNSVLRREKYGSKVLNFNMTMNDNVAIATITEHTKNYKTRNNFPLVNFSRFITLLKENNIHYKWIIQSCDLDNTGCSGIMELTFHSGTPIIVEFSQNNAVSAYNKKGELKFEFTDSSVDIKDYISARKDGSKTIQTLWINRMSYPAHIENHSQVYKTIQKIVHESKLNSVASEHLGSKRATRIYKIQRSRMGSLEIASTYSISHNITEEVFNASYSDFTFNYNGEKVRVSPSKAIEIIAQLGTKGLSCFFHGTFGTGKTVLQNYMAAEFSGMNLDVEFDVLQLNAQDITRITQLDLVDLMDQYFGENYATGKRLFILIDEMETISNTKGSSGHHSEASTTLLNLTDGQLSERYNCVVIGTSNAAPSELDPALFRSGRFEIQLEIAPLEATKARQLAKLLSTTEGHVFHMEQFEKLLTTTNKVGNTLMSAANTITLAEIYSCVMPESMDLTIRRILGLHVDTIIPPTVVPPIITPAPIAAPIITPATVVTTPSSPVTKDGAIKGHPSRKRRGQRR